ncbi:O-antigen ligase family protein [Hoeflea sp.]|uniref:O-antigen ligase family protein n=1 Tax=Hoeflea sp. TaxID=1940281 RepID=UPI003B52ACE5
MIRAFLDFWIRPRFRNYDLTNIVFYSTILCLGPLVGSLVSVFAISTAVYSTLHLATGRLRWAGPQPLKAIAIAFAAFFAADAVAALANPSATSLDEVVENLPFLGFAGIYSITFIDRFKLLRAVEVAALAGSLATLLVLVLWFGAESRPGLAARNAAVLALLGGLLYILNIGAAARRRDRTSIGFLVAALAAACVVVLSGTRAIWPLIAIAPFIAIACFGSRRVVLLGIPAILLAVMVLSMVGLTTSQVVQGRVAAFKSDIDAMADGDFSGSLGHRIQIYKAGYELFFDRPLLGYGPGNERAEIAHKTAETDGQPLAYSHAHNALLNSALRSGLLGVMALIAVMVTPLVVAARARKDEVGWAGFHVLAGLFILYAMSGTVGLSLGHDIHDSVYIAGTCYCLYLIFGRTEASGRPEPSRADHGSAVS